MFLIVGLGNPGKEYENTRHNIGFMVSASICRHHNFSGKKLKFHSEIFEGTIDGHKIMLMNPLKYMNLSGICVAQAANFLKIPLENIIVIHDDIDLLVGKIRIKIGGGSGGHNGLKDIDARLGKEYKRVRIGIGHPGDRDIVPDYVLNNFSKEDRIIIDRMAEDAGKHINLLLGGKPDLFMTKVARPAIAKAIPSQ
jgi:PTH1 family peptidyl-tRNA hydrolase